MVQWQVQACSWQNSSLGPSGICVSWQPCTVNPSHFLSLNLTFYLGKLPWLADRLAQPGIAFASVNWVLKANKKATNDTSIQLF